MKHSELKQIIREEIQKVLSEGEDIEIGKIDLGDHRTLWISETKPEDNHPGYVKISTSGSVIWISKEKLEEFKNLLNQIK